jgi:hypothetical protein
MMIRETGMRPEALPIATDIRTPSRLYRRLPRISFPDVRNVRPAAV